MFPDVIPRHLDRYIRYPSVNEIVINLRITVRNMLGIKYVNDFSTAAQTLLFFTRVVPGKCLMVRQKKTCDSFPDCSFVQTCVTF